MTDMNKHTPLTFLDLRNASKLNALLAMGKPIALTKRGKRVATVTPEKGEKKKQESRKAVVMRVRKGLDEIAKKAGKIPAHIKIDRAFIYEW